MTAMTRYVYHDADRPYDPPAPLDSDMAITGTGRVIRHGEMIGWLCDGDPFCGYCTMPTTTQETTPMTTPDPATTTVVAETAEVTGENVTVEPPDTSTLLPPRARLIVYLVAAMVSATWGGLVDDYDFEPWVGDVMQGLFTGAFLLAGANVYNKGRR